MAKRKNKFAFPIGVIALILAIVGAVTVVKFTMGSVKNITDNSAKKAEYEKFLKPVVMFDPDPFDDLTQADVPQLVNSAVWALLMSDGGTEQYAFANGGMIVPQEDIEKYFVELFGTEIDLASMHSSIDMSGYEITYDSAMKSYIIPVTGIESAYVPKVYEIEKQGSSVILTVGYIGNKAWAQVADGEYAAPEPDKYMKITLRERSGGMYISSIQAADGQEVIAASAQFVTAPAETFPPATEPAETETQAVTEPATMVVEVTDEDGDTVYGRDGRAVTEYITAEAPAEEIPSEETTEE